MKEHNVKKITFCWKGHDPAVQSYDAHQSPMLSCTIQPGMEMLNMPNINCGKGGQSTSKNDLLYT